MEPYLDKGYHLFIDNWYNSVSLTQYMSKRNTYITSTLLADWKRNPSQVIGKNFKRVKWFSCLLVIFLSISRKIKRYLCHKQCSYVNNDGFSQRTLQMRKETKLCPNLQQPFVGWELIDQFKCVRITLHCEKL